MWARVMEAMLGCWLLVSPFIFLHGSDGVALWTVDLTAGSAVIGLALLSYWHPTRGAHFFTLAVATALTAIGYFSGGYPAAAALQNEIIIGLLLLMLAIVPNHASQPSPAWQEYS